MEEKKFQFGMVGLGTMGRNLVLNMADHNYSIAGFDKNAGQVETLLKEAQGKNVDATTNLQEFVKSLQVPRTIIMLVPAGPIVDSVIADLRPFLSEGDLLMDWGNSHFTDTNDRYTQLAKSSLHFMGVGISGGESGARFGPSIMPGGPKEVYDRVKSVLDSISAKVNNEPCVKWLGNGAAGHYVKMVHNGIEYGLMQLLSEAYHVLKYAGLTNDELHTTFDTWNKGILHSFLVEITAHIFKQKDDLTGNSLIDVILDTAHQKGTGGWTSRDAMNLQVPIPVIDMSVTMREISAYKKERVAVEKKLKGPDVKFKGDKKKLIDSLEQALHFCMVTTYAQGLGLLHVASEKYSYELNIENIASIWRGGCIIRATLLEDIRKAYAEQPDLSNLLLSDGFSQKLMESQRALRQVIITGVEAGIPLMAMTTSLGYYDSYRSGWMPANLVQAQRDYFGAHTYERTDREGTFHTHWS